jgi:uncharacterized metal-binding protein
MPCSCGKDSEAIILITACSGAANTGLLADQVARGLRSEKAGTMTCLAALGAELSGYVESARQADLNVVIDGCLVGCGAKIHAKLGIPFEQHVMTEYGVEKGKTVITPEVVAEVTAKVIDRIGLKGRP